MGLRFGERTTNTSGRNPVEWALRRRDLPPAPTGSAAYRNLPADRHAIGGGAKVIEGKLFTFRTCDAPTV